MSYATAPLGFWQLLKKCFAGYMPVYKNAWQLILLFAVITFAYGVMVYNQTHVGILVASLAIFFLIATFINAAILHLGDAALASKPVSLREAMQVAKQRYGSFLVCYFVLMVVVMFLVTFLKIAMLLILGSQSPETIANTPLAQLPSWWAAIFIVFSIIFLIISVFFYLAPMLVIVEKQTAATAFKQSADRVKGHWWRVLGILLIVYLIIGLIFIGLNSIVNSAHPVVLSLQDVIVQLIIYPLPIATGLSLLNDLRLRVKK